MYHKILNALFLHFSKHIILDASLSNFVFHRKDINFTHSLSTFVYLEKTETGKWALAYIGKEKPKNGLTENIFGFDLFDISIELPLGVSREESIQSILAYGIGMCFEKEFLPPLRPVVFLLGASRFTQYFENPGLELEKILKLAGAGVVIFDRTEL